MAEADTSDEQRPGMAMLEYLGEWESTGDEWVDPMTLYENGLLDMPQKSDRLQGREKRRD